tara:strand:- start:110 stop:781 length:672 start_codon:yes stop_codon:yes gene_type:complete
LAKIVIFGAGGGADTAYRYFKSDTNHEIVAFTQNTSMKDKDQFHGLPVVDFENVEDVYPPNEYQMFLLISFDQMSKLRIGKYNEIKKKGYTCASYVASNIFRISEIDVGENCFICENQTINLDVKIGNNVVLWSNNHVGDRTIIKDHVWVTSHVSIGGDVVIGEGCLIGMNSTISHGIKLGKKVFLGAGAVLSKDTKDNEAFAVKGTKPLGLDSETFYSMTNM